MKKLLILLVMTFLTQESFALNRYQQNHILLAMEKKCQSTLCGEEFDFDFDRLECDAQGKTCRLTFEFVSNREPDGEETPFRGVCHFEGATRMVDFLEGRSPAPSLPLGLRPEVETGLLSCLRSHLKRNFKL